MSNKTSLGIALFRNTIKKSGKKTKQILLIKMRFTYSFSAFVFSKYNPRDLDAVRKRLDGTTSHEKLLIAKCEFDNMWRHIWMSTPDPESGSMYQFYLKCKIKFERFIQRDGGKRLRTILSETTAGELQWEIPKGRANPDECEIDAAKRELREETNIETTQYAVLALRPFVYSYQDDACTYVCKYYLANSHPTVTACMDYNNTNQISEIAGVGWFGEREASHIVRDGCKSAIRYLFKQYRKSHLKIETS